MDRRVNKSSRNPAAFSQIWLVTACVSFGTTVFAASPEIRDGKPLYFDRMRSPLARSDLRISPAQSCAAAACHGGAQPGVLNPAAQRGTEYLLWLEQDPHARSWRTLCTPESNQLLERLSILKNGVVVDKTAFDNCLNCHNSTRRFSETRTQSWAPEGIGCAACHGPDMHWGNQHYIQGWEPDNQLANGFVPLENLVVRARICASCHVGDADRDMNHDLIAAGHPRLSYEFAAYHALLPKHWRDEREANSSDFEVRLWLAGQIANLDASLALLEKRASLAGFARPWPELSEYACAACHHDLAGVSTESDAALSDKSDRLHYATSNRAGAAWILAHEWQSRTPQHRIHFAESEDLRQALRLLESLMSRHPLSTQPMAVRQAAEKARMRLDRWLQSPSSQMTWAAADAQWLSGLTASVQISANGRFVGDVPFDWESAAQLYAAFVAARFAWPEGPQGTLLQPMRELKTGLSYLGRENTFLGPQSARHRGLKISLPDQIRNIQRKLNPENQVIRHSRDGT